MHNLPAYAIRDRFLKGEFTAEEITRHFLKRIELLDEKIGAFLSVLSERSIAQAKAVDAKRAKGQPMGPLAGVPIAIKDNIHLQGELSTCASKFLVNYRACFQATAVNALEDADAIFIGKTNMDEFAMGSSTENSALQVTRNPWNLGCSPGGSSGGSAAAVAARLSPIALGSDTGGSIRQPAALCGVVGYKPTYGRISRYGLVAYGSSLDQIGPFATCVKDAGLAMEVMGRHCPMDATSYNAPQESYLSQMTGNIKGMKIGVPWEFLQGFAEEPTRVFKRSLEKLKELGAEIVDVDLSILKYSLSTYYVLATAEASTNLARFDGVRYGVRSSRAQTLDQVYDFSKEEGFGPEVKRRILLGTYVLSAGYQDAFYKKAQKVRTLMKQSFKTAFEGCDLIATPVTPFAAFEIGSIKDPLQMYLEDIYTIGVNLTGTPAVSIPNGFTTDGRPFGIQLIGPQKHDVRVLSAAYALEQATPEYQQVPPLAK